MMIVGTSVATAQAGQAGTVPTGNDISYPQCGQAFPSGQAFGIVAVNEGVANITNSCLAAEMAWARASSGASRQPRVARTRGVPAPGHYRWWLDVETVNSWTLSAQDNRADLEGMATYFRSIGGAVGIYSTMKQWGPLTGTIGPASPLYRLPDWLAGAKTLAQAEKNCRLVPLTGGGTVAVTQWAAFPANRDFACPPSLK